MRVRLLFSIVLIALCGSGCFKEPKPKCSFLCGAAGECPAGYTCGASDHRCHLVLEGGAQAVCEDTLPPDAPPSADGPTVDTAPAADGVPDGAADAPGAPDAVADAPEIDAEIADAPAD